MSVEVAGRCENSPGRGRNPLEVPAMPDRTCSVPGCDKRHNAHGYCGMHYMRWVRYGDPLADVSRALKVEVVLEPYRGRPAHECWLWRGSIDNRGYGRVQLAGQRHGAHRLSYEYFIGPIPDGLVIDHLCRNRACVNPAHLEPVTNRENILRGEGAAAQNARRTAALAALKEAQP